MCLLYPRKLNILEKKKVLGRKYSLWMCSKNVIVVCALIDIKERKKDGSFFIFKFWGQQACTAVKKKKEWEKNGGFRKRKK